MIGLAMSSKYKLIVLTVLGFTGLGMLVAHYTKLIELSGEGIGMATFLLGLIIPHGNGDKAQTISVSAGMQADPDAVVEGLKKAIEDKAK